MFTSRISERHNAIASVRLFVSSTYRASFSASPICCWDVEAGCARRPLLDLRPLQLVTVGDRSFTAAGSHDYGTVYLSTSSLPCHPQHFVTNWKHIYFGNHIRTLFFNCFAI